QRLARENGWKLEFTRRVVAEYKRFIFLAIVAGHAVTPSQQVDQAWHLHLLYTRSYWDDFCGQVLGLRIHHGPTQGGSAEQAKYRDWYDRT
ncbi:glycine-rich domain-containing protein, partial [Enterococcus casseliflavus]|uniref:glycine-rich domain-containing protein n=1 Tax=Enterococcus casseliflavus TaxID=37734 RepID=UPI003D0B174B